MIINLDGELQLKDLSNVNPTKIKLTPGRNFVLNKGDFIDIGVSHLIHIVECSTKSPPKAGDDKNINTRFYKGCEHRKY